MYYKLKYDMDTIEMKNKEGQNYIYADDSTIDEIEYPGFKKGGFKHAIYSFDKNLKWPVVDFYYHRPTCSADVEFLGNIDNWPIFHKNVVEEFQKLSLPGLQFYPIYLVDLETELLSRDYYALFVTNLIDAIDMEKSDYDYEEDFDTYFFSPKGVRLDADKCKGQHIFRDMRDKYTIYVSEEIRQLIKNKDWVGFKFYRVATTDEEQELIDNHGLVD